MSREDRRQQRVVGAAQQQRVDLPASRVEHRRDRTAHNVLDERPLEPAGLDEWHKIGRGRSRTSTNGSSSLIAWK